MSNVIEKHQVNELKKWMIDYLVRNEELYYVNLSGYEDYKFVDMMFFKIIKDFEDHIQGVSNSISFETISHTKDDKIILTNCRISIYNEIQKTIGRDGSIVYIEYEDDALWHSKMYLKSNYEEAKRFANIMIETEIGGLNNKIEEMEEIKENINQRF